MDMRCPRSFIKFFLHSLLLAFVSNGCSNPPRKSNDGAHSSRYLYVSSGLCYSGQGNTTFTNTTASNLVYRINLSTGQKDLTLADYNASPSLIGDTPVGLASIDSDNLLVLVENTTTTGARRVDKISKQSNGARTLFSSNTAALSAVLRDLQYLSNGDLLISKSSAIEKITSSNVRILKGAAPYVNAPAAPCATSTTLISKVQNLNNGFIMYLHAAASQNRFGFVKPAGYGTAGDCTVAQAAPVATAYPVAVAYDPANAKILVAYSGNSTATDINSIYAYTLTETVSSVAVSSPEKIYDASLYPVTYPYILYGITDMLYDEEEAKLYIATAINTSTTVVNYAIERFSYDATKIGSDNTNVLTRDGSLPFYDFGGDTKCISDMIISD